MEKLYILPISLVLLLGLSCFLLLSTGGAQIKQQVSGTVLEGYRLLTIPDDAVNIEFTVYRGDYLKFVIKENLQGKTLSIPSLGVNQTLVMNLQVASYVKMKKTGVFQFSLGETTGLVRVIEYDKPQYRAVTAEEASQLVKNISPVILDVRTTSEYNSGHLENSIHIPVQEIQRRFGELSALKNDTILIYCATGNRSTVASKILIDNGFSRIYNLREGIHIWAKKGYPVVR